MFAYLCSFKDAWVIERKGKFKIKVLEARTKVAPGAESGLPGFLLQSTVVSVPVAILKCLILITVAPNTDSERKLALQTGDFLPSVRRSLSGLHPSLVNCAPLRPLYRLSKHNGKWFSNMLVPCKGSCGEFYFLDIN